MAKDQESVKTITRPQFEALRTAEPIAEWQALPQTHPLACLKERHAVFAPSSTVKVLKRLGLVEVAEGAISEDTGRPWGRINALTPAGEALTASLERGGPLVRLDTIAHAVKTAAHRQPAADLARISDADRVRIETSTDGGKTWQLFRTHVPGMEARAYGSAARRAHHGRFISDDDALIIRGTQDGQYDTNLAWRLTATASR